MSEQTNIFNSLAIELKIVCRKAGYEIDGMPDGGTVWVFVKRVVYLAQDKENKRITHVHLETGDVLDTCDTVQSILERIQEAMSETT